MPILEYLEACRDGKHQQQGIPRMVRNYFAELALLIFESAAFWKPGAPFVMVNDNVRYQGAHVPVDLILSDFAEQAGLMWKPSGCLPRGKGNSSQQMGLHGREEIRKCVLCLSACLKAGKPIREVGDLLRHCKVCRVGQSPVVPVGRKSRRPLIPRWLRRRRTVSADDRRTLGGFSPGRYSLSSSVHRPRPGRCLLLAPRTPS